MSNDEMTSLEAKVEELQKRVEKLECLLAAAAGSAPSGQKGTRTPATDGALSREIILAISAAVAAFLGKRASIRQIRLTGQTEWAMQGRATVQASHGIEFVRGLR